MALTNPLLKLLLVSSATALIALGGTGMSAQDRSAEGLKPGEGPWANYDFVPGSRVIFFEDFARDIVGDFPKRLKLVEGNLEIVAWRGARYLRATSNGEIIIPLPETLPARFTLEFDYRLDGLTMDLFLVSADQDLPSNLSFGMDESGIVGEVTSRAAASQSAADGVIRGRVMADGNHVKVYMNEKRVGNAPAVALGRSSAIRVRFAAHEDGPFLLGNIRVAAGGRPLYDALAADGRIATQGILFDTGSDRIQPESTPTLKEIGGMLVEHPDLRIRIEGHTDDVGDDAANLALSQKRANAVREYLVRTFGIAATRLETQGLGETKPVGSNQHAEGRQQNRRVELVKLGGGEP